MLGKKDTLRWQKLFVTITSSLSMKQVVFKDICVRYCLIVIQSYVVRSD